MVIMVFHEPSGPRIEEVNTLWSGLFNSVTSLNLEGVCGLGTGPSVSHVRIFFPVLARPSLPNCDGFCEVAATLPRSSPAGYLPRCLSKNSAISPNATAVSGRRSSNRYCACDWPS